MGAEPFSAKLRYVGPEDPEHSNLIKLTVMLPHTDGRWAGLGASHAPVRMPEAASRCGGAPWGKQASPGGGAGWGRHRWLGVLMETALRLRPPEEPRGVLGHRVPHPCLLSSLWRDSSGRGDVPVLGPCRPCRP